MGLGSTNTPLTSSKAVSEIDTRTLDICEGQFMSSLILNGITVGPRYKVHGYEVWISPVPLVNGYLVKVFGYNIIPVIRFEFSRLIVAM